MRPDPTRCLLLIDDEPAQRRLVSAICGRAGWWVRGAGDIEAATRILNDPEEPKIDAILLDHWLPGDSGSDVIAELRALRPQLPLLVLTAQTSVAVAVDAMRAGAADFLVKPLAPDRLLAALDAATDRRKSTGELRPLSEKISKHLGFEEIVGSAPEFRSALAIAAKAARARVSILIEGESGSGKEIFAQAIHAASPRAKKPLVTVNCGAIPSNLVESVLFGHEKGAFTGAFDRHIGRFEDADGSTCSSTRSASFRSTRRSSCCARSRTARSSGSAAASSRMSTCASSPPPTARSPRKSPRVASARTSITASTSSMSAFRRCATGSATFQPSSATSSPGSPSSRACGISRSPTTGFRC
jgi:DNA-binding response OmpR family regulator